MTSNRPTRLSLVPTTAKMAEASSDELVMLWSSGLLTDEEDASGLMAILDEHIPSFDLASHAFGLEPQTLDRRTLEQHLSSCSACQAELALICEDRNNPRIATETKTPARVLPFPTRLRTATPAWRLAAAAALAVGAVSASLWQNDRPALDQDGPTAALSAPSLTSGESTPAGGRLLSTSFESGDLSGWSLVHNGTDTAAANATDSTI